MEDFPDDDEAQEKPAQKEENVEKEEVDQALIDKALDDFRGLFRGNGFDAKKIELKSFEGEVLTFETFEVFKLETSITEKHVPGKEQGDVAGSHTEAQQKVAATLERITLDREIKKMTINLLKKRPDMGFGIDGLIIPLDRLNKKFVTHEACSTCQTTGKILCQHCQGKQQIVCTRCHGHCDEQCHFCNGTQFTETPQGRQQCTHCHGTGRIGCTMCRQTGEMPCPKCKSTGKMPCQPCSNTGWNSHIFIVGIKAKSKFAYDEEALPEELPELLEEYRSSLLLDEHAEVRIVEEQKKDDELDERSESDEFIIPYEVRLPWGDIAFSIKEKEIGGKLFGYEPLIKFMPPILQKVVAKGILKLEKAASGHANAAKQIHEALRYRIVGDAFVASLNNSPNKALAVMRDHYPYAIEENTLKKTIMYARKSTGHLVKKPRINGIVAGSAISFLFYIAYLFSLRGIIVTDTMTDAAQILMDAIALCCGILICTISTHINAAKALKKALNRLNRSAKENTIMPKISESCLWGAPAGIGLFFIALVLAHLLGANMPPWLNL